jgi:hypothetical protein
LVEKATFPQKAMKRILNCFSKTMQNEKLQKEFRMASLFLRIKRLENTSIEENKRISIQGKTIVLLESKFMFCSLILSIY